MFFLSCGTFSNLLLVTFPLSRAPRHFMLYSAFIYLSFSKHLNNKLHDEPYLWARGNYNGLLIIIPIRSEHFPALGMPLEKEKAYLDEMGPCCYNIKLLELKQIKIFQHAIVSLTKSATLARGTSTVGFITLPFRAPLDDEVQKHWRRHSFPRIPRRCVNAGTLCLKPPLFHFHSDHP